jgi:hypothetical protein
MCQSLEPQGKGGFTEREGEERSSPHGNWVVLLKEEERQRTVCLCRQRRLAQGAREEEGISGRRGDASVINSAECITQPWWLKPTHICYQLSLRVRKVLWAQLSQELYFRASQGGKADDD